MKSIRLYNVLPHVFREQPPQTSDVWQREVTFEQGKSYLVRAMSGTGKSSLCAYIMGQRHDFDGHIEFDGTDTRSLSQSAWTELRQRHLSHVYQELRLFPELTALENIEIKNTLTGHQKRKQIRRWLEELGIGDKEKTAVGRLSFGQQQRVAIIRALCQPFDFLLIDEPVSHLDDTNAAIVGRIVCDECQRAGAGLIVTSIGRDLQASYDQTLEL